MDVLLDTSALIDFDDIATGIANEFPGAKMGISIVTIAELHYGVLVATDTKRAERLTFLSAVRGRYTNPYEIDDAVAVKWSEFSHAVRLAGRQPRSRVNDLWIAATAAMHNLALVTRNGADFEAVKHHLANLVDI